MSVPAAPANYEEEYLPVPSAPSILASGQTGMRLSGRWILQKAAFADAGQTQEAVQWQLATDAGFEDLIADTGLRTVDGVEVDDNAWTVFPERLRILGGSDDEVRAVASGDVIRVRCRVLNQYGALSPWSSTATFTFETAEQPFDAWAEAQ